MSAGDSAPASEIGKRSSFAWAKSSDFGLGLAILIALGAIWLLDKQGAFFTSYSLNSLIHQAALFGVLALGAAIVIISGGIDLSVGSVVALASVVFAKLAMSWLPAAGSAPPQWGAFAAAVALTIALGVAVGLLHAFLINRLALPPFIATLATLAGLRSVAKVISQERKDVIAESYRFLGANVWWSAGIFAACAVVLAILLGRTVIGRHLYAIGGNEPASRLSGLPVARNKAIAYCISGALAALAGILFAGKVGQGDPTSGMAYELRAITAAVVGGCSLRGGYGSIRGTVLGLFLIEIIIKGTGLVVGNLEFSLLGYPIHLNLNSTQIEGLVLGIVIVLAVALNQRLRGGRS